jgi:predicted metal-binding membrane protein
MTQSDLRVSAVTPVRYSATAVLVAAMLGVTAACWVAAVQQMRGMDMGTETTLGSFGFFIVVWVAMMAAMMLPGAVPAALRHAGRGAGVAAVPWFVGSYLAVWAAAGVVLYALYRPHGTAVAGGVVIAAGLYELTPLKRHFRRQCRETLGSGVLFGVSCLGSSAGLMLMLVVLGVMSLPWMVVATVLIVAQKVLPALAAVDVPLALAIVGLGIFILLAPSALPGLTPALHAMTPAM